MPPAVAVKDVLAAKPLMTAEVGETALPGGPLTTANVTVRPLSTVGETETPSEFLLKSAVTVVELQVAAEVTTKSKRGLVLTEPSTVSQPAEPGELSHPHQLFVALMVAAP